MASCIFANLGLAAQADIFSHGKMLAAMRGQTIERGVQVVSQNASQKMQNLGYEYDLSQSYSVSSDITIIPAFEQSSNTQLYIYYFKQTDELIGAKVVEENGIGRFRMFNLENHNEYSDLTIQDNASSPVSWSGNLGEMSVGERGLEERGITDSIINFFTGTNERVTQAKCIFSGVTEELTKLSSLRIKTDTPNNFLTSLADATCAVYGSASNLKDSAGNVVEDAKDMISFGKDVAGCVTLGIGSCAFVATEVATWYGAPSCRPSWLNRILTAKQCFGTTTTTIPTTTTTPDGSSIAKAIPLSIPGEISGQSVLANQSKYYKFTTTSTAMYQIASTGSSDTVGYLYDSSGAQLNNHSNDDDAGSGNNFSIVKRLDTNKTYYIKVRGFNNSSASYSIFGRRF